MKRLILMCLMVFLLVGCAEKSVCNKPYIIVGKDCCLDANDNNICDKDETKNTQVSTPSRSSVNSKVVSSVDIKELFPNNLKACIKTTEDLVMPEEYKNYVDEYQIKEFAYGSCDDNLRIMISHTNMPDELFAYSLEEGTQDLRYVYDGSFFVNNVRIESHSLVSGPEGDYHQTVYFFKIENYVIEVFAWISGNKNDLKRKIQDVATETIKNFKNAGIE